MNSLQRQLLAKVPWFLALLMFAATDSDADEQDATRTWAQLRARAEVVDQVNFAEQAEAYTVRGRLGLESGAWRGFRLLMEADAVTAIGPEHYNSGAGTSGPDRDIYPVIPDPDYVEVNQAYLSWQGHDSLQARIGRQRITLDNQRFIGNVGWRQNEQTFDAFTITGAAGPNIDWHYSYVVKVNRIFGDDVPAGNYDSDTHLLHASYRPPGDGKLVAYYYANNNQDVASLSSNTLGLRYEIGLKDLPTSPTLVAEYASQQDAADNPVDYSASYWRLDLGLNLGPVDFNLGHESLGGSSERAGAAFQTSLATLHAFNGWADQFLSTPDDGLTDRFAGLAGTLGDSRWQMTFHDFEAESGGRDLGREWDASINWQWHAGRSLLFKLADYRGGPSGPVDTRKAWVMLTLDFSN